MKRKKSKKSFLFLGIIILLLFLSSLSLLHMRESFYLYRVAKESRNDARLEKEYVQRQLDDMRTYILKKRYDSEGRNFAREKKFKKIDLRGVELSPDKNRPFSKSEVRFNVIEQ